uniref:Uncharacterized protein n=1 Tax=Anopheles coluzzii TaxID=1518534 RepID=A0A8W7Q148_ANOCL
MQRPSLHVYSSGEQVRPAIRSTGQFFSSSPLLQSCLSSQRHCSGMQSPSSHLNSLIMQSTCFFAQFSSSLQSPQSLSPSHRNRIRTQRPPGPPIPPRAPLHLNSPSGQLCIGRSQFASSDSSIQSVSPSHWNEAEMQDPSLHRNSSRVHLRQRRQVKCDIEPYTLPPAAWLPIGWCDSPALRSIAIEAFFGYWVAWWKVRRRGGAIMILPGGSCGRMSFW